MDTRCERTSGAPPARGATDLLMLLLRLWTSDLKAPLLDPTLLNVQPVAAAAEQVPETPPVGKDLDVSRTGSGDDVELALDLRR